MLKLRNSTSLTSHRATTATAAAPAPAPIKLGVVLPGTRLCWGLARRRFGYKMLPLSSALLTAVCIVNSVYTVYTLSTQCGVWPGYGSPLYLFCLNSVILYK